MHSRIRKVIIDDLDVQRKRRVTLTYAVSTEVEEFTCEGCALNIDEGRKPSRSSRARYGVSKREFRISIGAMVNDYRGKAFG